MTTLARGAPAAADCAPGTGCDAYGSLLAYAAIGDPGAGFHRTGTEGDRLVSDWLRSELTAAGLSDVRAEEFPFLRFVPRSFSLAVGDLAPAVFPLYYSGRTPGVTGSLVYVGAGTPADFQAAPVSGKVVLVDVPLVAGFFAPTLNGALSSARKGGALGVVAAIAGPLNEIVAQNADSRTGPCSLPTLLVGKQDGAALRARAGQTATLVLDADYENGSSQNTIGVLQGDGDSTIVIGTPVNGWFTTGAERGGGVGTLVTLARHFAAQGRPAQTLVFLATGGHEVGFLGADRYVTAHAAELGAITAYVHMGASIAAKGVKEVAGEAVETGVADENRALFVSENPILEALAEASMKSNLAAPIASIPPRVLNPGEQQFMYNAGVPIVSISGAHFWFHTAGDTADTTSAELLDPVVKGYRQIVEGLLALDRATVRAANALPAATKPAFTPPVCPGS